MTLMAMTSPATSPEYIPRSPFMPEPPKRRNWTFIVAAIVGVVVVAAAAAAIAVGLTWGSSDKPTATASAAAPASFQVIGVIRLQRGGFVWGEAGESDLRCQGWRGYDDIQPGTQVVVRDSHGATVATGALEQGKAEGIEDSGSGFKLATTCAFAFTVNGVPAGKGFYSIEVSHRSQMQFNEQQMHSPISLQLG